MWRALADQFQRNTCANKLELKQKLFSLWLAEGGSVQQHIMCMREIWDELSAIGETVSEEDRVVYLLASLLESYNVLVTAQEANAYVPLLADDSTDSENTGLVVQHALSSKYNAPNCWILDSGATCYMCNQERLFSDFQHLQKPLNVVLGDGRSLLATCTGQGSVMLKMKLPNGRSKPCTLHNVLLVPSLAYNLLSVTSASKKGKIVTFSKMKCEIRDNESSLLAVGWREGSFYYLDNDDTVHQACPS